MKRIPVVKISMELYLNFIHSDKKFDLAVDHLNQIIGMQGFKKKKMPKQQKSVVIETVNSMELMVPARSTVNVDGVSGDAFLSIEEVIKDLSELKWQECSVTSLQTLNATDHHQPLQDSPEAGFASSQPKRKRRLRKAKDTVNDNGDLRTPWCSFPLVTKWVTKKRSTRRFSDGNFGWGGGGKLDDAALAARLAVEDQLWPSSSSEEILP